MIEVIKTRPPTGSIRLTPKEHRISEDRCDCYWVYVVTDFASAPTFQHPISNPAWFRCHEVTKVARDYLRANAPRKPMKVREQTVSTEGRQGISSSSGPSYPPNIGV